MTKHIVSYYLRLKGNINNNILKDAYEYTILKSTSFCKIIDDIDNLKGWKMTNENLGKQEIKVISKQIQTDLQNEYKKHFFKKILNPSGNKERLSYSEIKSDYSIEKYLDRTFLPDHKIMISRFRLGVQKLRINTGHYEEMGAVFHLQIGYANAVKEIILKMNNTFFL